jgi:parallel beta-helix repeat protein
MVDAAAAGSTVTVPAGIYRESVTVATPMRLLASAGAEIRGSDVWTEWTRHGSVWESTQHLSKEPVGECRPGSSDCPGRHQVFIDGQPLDRVDRTPATGEFSISPTGRVLLGSDPANRAVEVSTRDTWITIAADDVTIEGFSMRHATTKPQFGGITARDVNNATIRANRLTESHGAGISIGGGTGHSVVGNDISNNGQLGLHLSSVVGTLVESNVIRHNNTADFDPGWEAGGMKAARAAGLRVFGNEVCANAGPGLWCDISCRDVVIQNNRVHGNENAGIHFEVSRGGDIVENVVWSNGWMFPRYGWGAGILISSSADVRVTQNLVAWNADGISVISQGREDGELPAAIEVERNTILVGPIDIDTFALAWLEDWPGGMFRPDRVNAGAQNRYWFPTAEDAHTRYAWDGGHARLDSFNATPGEEAATYLTGDGLAEILRTRALPGP